MATFSQFKQIRNGQNGFPYRDDDYKWKFLWHYTVRPLPAPGAAERIARIHTYVPHFWTDVPNREIVQSVDTDLAAYALENTSLPGETNADRVIQVELLGDEATILAFTDEDLWWLARTLVRPVILKHPIEPNWIDGRLTGHLYGNTAYLTSPARLGQWEWDNYSGHLGHQNAYENVHTDGLAPGQIEKVVTWAYLPDGAEPPWITPPIVVEPEPIDWEAIAFAARQLKFPIVSPGGQPMRVIHHKGQDYLLFDNCLITELSGPPPEGLPDWTPSQRQWERLVDVNAKVRTLLGLNPTFIKK